MTTTELAPRPPATDTRRYTVISADTHAGGSHSAYREYLDPRYLEEFDAWRGRYKNPYADLGDERRFRNWDNEMRNGQQDEDGVVGEVIFPNTVPPFFPTFILFAPPPSAEDYERRLAGIRAHNRWLVDFCSQFPHRRAGIGQIFVNDLDDTLKDLEWIKAHDLRGGVLLPPAPPDAPWIKPYNHPDYDRLWAACQDLDLPVNIHGGVGAPAPAPLISSAMIMVSEIPFYSRRPLLHMLLSGVFERFPRLRVVLTEQGCGWVPELLFQLDMVMQGVRDNKALGELRFTDEQILPRSATEYFRQNVWIGGSAPTRWDTKAVTEVIGIDRFMWGSDFPHDEGTWPFTREHLRQIFSGWSEDDLRKILSENAAEFYGFDLDALAPEAARFGPSVSEIATPLEELPEGANEVLQRGLIM